MPGHSPALAAAAAVLLYIAVTALQRMVVFAVPFDSETIDRFIVPFAFQGNAAIGWTLGESVIHGFFRPIYSLSFLMDYFLWGTDFRLYHVTDLLLSALTVAMLVRLLLPWLGARVTIPALVIWTLSPAQGWSMAVFTGRNDRLVTIFFLAALTLYDASTRAVTREARHRLEAACLLLAILGSFAKETSLLYLPVLFGWGWLVAGLGFLPTLRRSAALWASGLAAFVALMLFKPLLGIGLPPEFDPGPGLFSKFSSMVDWCLPLSIPQGVLPGIAVMALLVLAVALPFAGRTVRFGALLMFVSILPFSFVWIQRTFTWMPSLGLAILAAGLLDALRRRLRGSMARMLAAAFAMALLAGLFWWGRVETAAECDVPIAFKTAARYLVATGPGPVYDGWSAVREVPAVSPGGDASGPPDQASAKRMRYLEQLVRVMSGNPAATVAWDAPRPSGR